MRSIILTGILIVSTLFVSYGQIGLDKWGEKIKKSSELLKTGDVDGAIKVLSNVLKGDPDSKEALLLRAKAKFAAKAYKGVRNDCFAYMEKHGLDHQVSGLLGKNELAQGNYKQALSYLNTAVSFHEDGIEYRQDRARAYFDLGLDDDACSDWYHAAYLGDMESKKFVKKYCRNKVIKTTKDKPKCNDKPKQDTPAEKVEDEVISDGTRVKDTDTKKDKPTTETNTDQENKGDVISDGTRVKDGDNKEDNNQKDEVISDGTKKSDQSNTDTNEDNLDIKDDTSYESDEPFDVKVEKIYIDEYLSLEVANGIGSRKVVEIPEMLILSDKSGRVVVDICVNRIGEVTSAKLNEEKTTILTKGLVSLALRKSSKFWFERKDTKNHCGTLTFIISADKEE